MEETNNQEKTIQAFFTKYQFDKLQGFRNDTGNIINSFNARGFYNSTSHVSAILNKLERYLFEFIDFLVDELKTNNTNFLTFNNQITLNIINSFIDEFCESYNFTGSIKSCFEIRINNLKERIIEKWNNEVEIEQTKKETSECQNNKVIKLHFPEDCSHYLDISVKFIQKAYKLINEDDETSHRIAIISVYHGLEFFLYACLEDPLVNFDIFCKKDETIGFKPALMILKEHIIKNYPEKDLEYKSQLSRLNYLRNEIVHKAAHISQKDGQYLVNIAIRFVNINSQRLWKTEIFKIEDIEIQS